MNHVGALADLKVLEIGELTAAPYAAKLLADYGAEVTKVEFIGKDAARRMSVDQKRTGSFLYLNTNKLSVALDPAQPLCRPILDALLRRSDIVISNLEIKTLQMWGLSPAQLREKSPQLVVTTITPFGAQGPYANFVADELVTAAMGGIVYSTPGMPDASEHAENEPPLHPGCQIAQTVGGFVGACAALLGIFARRVHGNGCYLDVSQQAAVSAMQQRDVSICSYTDWVFDRMLNPTLIGRMPNFYLPCKDGYAVVAAFLDKQWTNLVAAMGNPVWAAAPEFSSVGTRQKNWIELRFKLTEWTMTCTSGELTKIADDLGIPIFTFYPVSKLVESPQVQYRKSLVNVVDGTRRAQMPASPVGMQGTPWAIYRPAPKLGEHTRKVLGDWLGFEQGELASLMASGAIACGT